MAVPGEIAGFWEAHQRFGVLPWKDLFAPVIKAAQEGLTIGRALAGAIASNEEFIHNRTLNLWYVISSAGQISKEVCNFTCSQLWIAELWFSAILVAELQMREFRITGPQLCKYKKIHFIYVARCSKHFDSLS